MQDYSCFYFNVEGKYEDLVYYVSPLPEQKLYMIRKMNRFVDTNKILKSIETGFNGYDYEVYGVELFSFPLNVEGTDDEWAAACKFEDFSNKQIFEGYILFPETMPLFDTFFAYIIGETKDLPSLRYPEHKRSNKRPIIQFNEVEPPKPKEPVDQSRMQAQQTARAMASHIVQNDERNDNNQ